MKLLNEKIIVCCITIFICFIILEIGLRIIGRLPSNMIAGICEQWGNSYCLKKNIKKDTHYPAYSYTTYTNSFGFRDKTIGDRDISEKPYYIFLGASEVFANGVEYEDSFVGILAEHVSKKGITVLNMAIGGHRFPDQEVLLKDFLKKAPRKPPDIIFHCVNALHIPKFDMKNDNVIVKNGHLFDKDSWKVAYIRLMVGTISSSYCFVRDNIRKLQARWSDYDPTKDGEESEFFELYSNNNRMHNPATLKEFEAYLIQFEEFCEQNNINLIYVYLPIIDSYRLNELLIQIGKNPAEYDATYYENLIADYCQKRNMKYINLRPVMKKYYDEGKQLRFKLDPHYNKLGNRIVGEYLINELF